MHPTGGQSPRPPHITFQSSSKTMPGRKDVPKALRLGLGLKPRSTSRHFRLYQTVCYIVVVLLLATLSRAKPPLPPSSPKNAGSPKDAVQLHLDCAPHRGVVCDRSNVFVKARNGRYVVTSVSPKLSDAVNAVPLQMTEDSGSSKTSGSGSGDAPIAVTGAAPSAGDTLLGANGMFLPSSTLAEVLFSLVDRQGRGGGKSKAGAVSFERTRLHAR